MAGTLFLVATPIGNLGDFSSRAAQTFEAVDFIAAEDTRVTLKLLNHFGIKKPLVSYYEHNRAESGGKIISRLLAGESCALVTDAGMPAISDPGEDLVRLCAENGICVTVIPGACAVPSALALSGLPTGRFTFEGFLSTVKRVREAHLNSLKGEQRTMVFYEAPHRLVRTLADMADCFGRERKIALCREMTKIHEEVMRTTLGEACDYYNANTPRGEFVLVIAGAEPKTEPEMTLAEAVSAVLTLKESGVPLNSAARQIAAETGYAKNTLYDAAVKGV